MLNVVDVGMLYALGSAWVQKGTHSGPTFYEFHLVTGMKVGIGSQFILCTSIENESDIMTINR